MADLGPERLEQIRRSLAMSPSLSVDVAEEMLTALGRIRQERRALRDVADELVRLVERLRELAG